jgi:SNF2 family DNA or RNA helicase
MLTKDWVYDALQAMRPKLIAVDEASRFKEPTSERTIALFGGKTESRTYYGLVQNARHAVLLDGSPMPNRPMELWAPVTAMSPESIGFMDQHEFGVEYCGGRFIADGYKLDWDYRGATNQDKLKWRLQESFMHVVNENQLGHPERKRTMVFMNDVRPREMKTWEQSNLRQFNLKDLDEDMSQGDIAKHRQDLGLLKVPWVVSYVKDRYENKNESLLIFAWHREVCRQLAHELRSYRPGVVMGGTQAGERERIFDDFQAGRRRLIIGNIGAMGRGHNLQRAKRVVFAEYSWTDELNKQCEKRASRKGATNDVVRCDYIVVANSMDEIILNSVFTKAKNVKRVIG